MKRADISFGENHAVRVGRRVVCADVQRHPGTARRVLVFETEPPHASHDVMLRAVLAPWADYEQRTRELEAGAVWGDHDAQDTGRPDVAVLPPRHDVDDVLARLEELTHG